MEESSAEAAESGRRYSIEELVSLRTSAPFVLLNIDKLSTDAETSMIFNLPQKAKETRGFCIRTSELATLNKRAPLVERPGNNSTRRQANSRSIMGSGFDDDEDRVLYRGHPLRKDIRETQWQLRRRGTSDRSSQPVDAPTDIIAQKDDNFKAFFQAVRSPTHVRVTAGGRIVPNTRAPPQPVFKWNKEQQFFEQPKRQSSPDDGQTSGFYQEGVNLPQLDQRFHGVLPASGFPYFDAQLAMQASGAAGNDNITENTPISVSSTAPATTQEASAVPQPNTNHQGIQISPPENFDMRRPYWFHDRWIFPQGVEPPQHMLPFNLAGNPGMLHSMYGGYMPSAFAQQAAPPGMFLPPGNHAMGMHQPGQQLQYPYPQSMIFPGPQPLGNIANGLPVQPAPSGGPLFAPQFMQYLEDPNQRLARCREDLKKIDNDLENNAHQIDKPSKLVQRSLCVAEIQRLEALLSYNVNKQNQLAAGSGMLPKVPVRKASLSILKEGTPDLDIQKPVIVDSKLATSSTAPMETTKNEQKSVENSAGKDQKDSSEQVNVEPRVGTSSVRDKSSHRARLAAAAATAVFQPRSHQLPSSETDEQKKEHPAAAVTKVSSPSLDEKAKQSMEEARLLANALDWSVPSNMMGQQNRGPQAPYSHVAPPRPRQNEALGMPKVFPYAQVSAVSRAPIPSHGHAAPYLRGIQPIGNGIHVEYTYERQLTDDELRARCLYWGKAPRELQRGLPKYNGRDFFPPSPVKPSVKPSRSGELKVQAQLSDPFRDIDYSRTNQGIKEDRNDQDDISHNSWGEEVKSKKKSRVISPSHTLPKVNTTKREDRGARTDNDQDFVGEEQSTEASDRRLFGLQKRNPVETKVSSSSFLQDMLKNPRYTSSYDKEPSSYNFGGKPQSFEDRARFSTSTSAASMAAPLSGTITSATANGLLPLYHGSATASLTPNSESPERFGSKLFARFSSNSDLQEQQSPPRVLRNEENRIAPSRLAAAEYLRALASKEQREDQKVSSTNSDNIASEDNTTADDC